MKHLTIHVPISCTDSKLNECQRKLYVEQSISTSTNGPLCNKRLIVYLPESDLTTEELINIGIIIGAYIH